MRILREIKNLLDKHGLQPKKSLGQNFLINEKIYEDIIKAAEIKKGDTVLEVGPGLGTLTDYIAQAVGESGTVIAVEKDDQFVKILRDRFKDNKNVIIINTDILKFENLKLKIENSRYKVVGNIPYYLTSHLLKNIFENWSRPSSNTNNKEVADPRSAKGESGPRPERIVLTVQKEVSQRIVAKPPKSSLLSVSVQFFSEPEIIRTVKKENFWPRPKVDSAIIRLIPHEQLPFDEHQLFFKVVKAGFGEKRKQLINSLSNGLKISKQSAEEILKSAGVEPNRRAETVSIPEWIKIAKIYSSAS